MKAVEYAIRCPSCSSRATAQMSAVGRKGTYREALTNLIAKRIVCHVCGFCQDIAPEKSDAYELWYSADFKGHRLWAVNRALLNFLMSYISGDILDVDFSISDRAIVEAFPRWMILSKHKVGVLRCLKQMADRDRNQPVMRT